jgi:hypothetical protein
VFAISVARSAGAAVASLAVVLLLSCTLSLLRYRYVATLDSRNTNSLVDLSACYSKNAQRGLLDFTDDPLLIILNQFINQFFEIGLRVGL